MPAPETITEMQSRLVAERARLFESLVGVPREVMLRPWGDGGWSIKDILAHLAMAEAVNVKFARMMVEKEAPLQLREFAAEYPDFPGEFSLDKFNAWMTDRWRSKSLEEIEDALQRTRAETLEWLEKLSPAQLERTGEHAVWGNQTVRGMLRILVIHDRFHRSDIDKRKR